MEFDRKFVRFRIEPPPQPQLTSAQVRTDQPDVITVLMNRQQQVYFVQPVPSPRNQKEELANAVTSWLEREKVGFHPTDVETRGKYLVSVLTDVFWVIDGHM